MAAAGAAKANRELVAHEFTATTGEDGRRAGETCSLLLALACGELSDEAALWEYGAAEGRVTTADWVGMAGKANRLISRGRRRGVGEIASERSDW